MPSMSRALQDHKEKANITFYAGYYEDNSKCWSMPYTFRTVTEIIFRINLNMVHCLCNENGYF